VQYGVLNVQTLATPDDPSRGIVHNDPSNATVGRIRVQATRTLNVGMMMLGEHRFETDDGGYAGGGVDAQYLARDGRLQYYGFVAGSWAEQPGTPTVVEGSDIVAAPIPGKPDVGSSAHSFLQYRGLFVRPSLLWLWSDRDFDPRLGFYRRTGATRQQANIDFAPRPAALGLREIVFGPQYSIETTPGYDTRLGQEARARAQANWRGGSELGYEVAHFVDDVQAPFELYLHEVEAKEYTGFRQRVNAKTPSRRALEVDGSYEYIELFGGAAHQPSGSVTGRFGKHLTVSGRYTHLIGHLEDRREEFNFGFANGNVDIAITRNLAFDNLLRVDLSPSRERVGVQSRLRWRFLPGSDLFVVYRTDQPIGVDPIDELRRPFHEFTVKFTYYLRAFLMR
jgi:hypothetical protein